MAVSGGAAAAEEPPQILDSQRGIFALKWGRDGGRREEGGGRGGGTEGDITDSSFKLVWMDGGVRDRQRSTGGRWDRGGTEGGTVSAGVVQGLSAQVVTPLWVLLRLERLVDVLRRKVGSGSVRAVV